MINKETKYANSGAVITALPKDHEVFEKNQFLKLLKEIWTELGESDIVVGPIYAKTLCIELKESYKKSIAVNLRRVASMDKEIKRMTMLDPQAYADMLAKNISKEASIQNAIRQLREHVKNLDMYIQDLSSKEYLGTKAYEFANGIAQVLKFRQAIRAIAKDPVRLDWVFTKSIKTGSELQNILLDAGIGNINKSITEFANILESDSRLLISQLDVIKEFVRVADTSVYDRIVDLTFEKTPTISEVIKFAREFRDFYVTVRENEDFLKIDGLTEDLAKSISSILNISNLLNKIGLGSFDEQTQEVMGQIAKATLEQNSTKLGVAYKVVNQIYPRIFDVKEEEINEETKDKLIYLLSVGVYSIFDISGGTLALNIIDKLTK
ncbi:MAG: hypothetical protein ACRCX2_17985 [Paraclostridium sp.]